MYSLLLLLLLLLDPQQSAPKRHLDRFSRFCTVHLCDQHTDTQTTLRATSVAIGRILCTACRRCGAKCWGLALTNFGRDPRSRDSLRGSRNFCEVNNARFSATSLVIYMTYRVTCRYFYFQQPIGRVD